MDIKAASSAANVQSPPSALSEARESRVNEERQGNDSTIERKEAEASERRRGIGERFDFEA